MLGETDANWQNCIERTLELDPDSVTIYQMELPFNTTISGDILKGTGQFSEQVANWETRRRWVREAFDALEARRLHDRQRLHRRQGPVAHDVPLSRPAVGRRGPRRSRRRVVRARERRAHAEPGHVGDVRRRDRSRRFAARARVPPVGRRAADSGSDPAAQARHDSTGLLSTASSGSTSASASRRSGTSIRREGYLAAADDDRIALTREGLLRVDMLLHRFFLPEHQGVRYT